MAFYECREEISKHIGELLNSILVRKGLETKRLVDEHKALTNMCRDPYSHALLMTNVPRREAPLFSNVPRPAFSWLIRDHFEEVFKALDLPTSQQCASQFQRSLRNKGSNEILDSQQEIAVLKIEFIAQQFTQVSRWHLKAREELLIMNSNVALLSTVTEEEREFGKSLSFDWWYDYSDDMSVYRSGKENRERVAKHVNTVLATKPHLAKVVQAVAKANGFSESFFTKPA